jgi:hypothetical protein
LHPSTLGLLGIKIHNFFQFIFYEIILVSLSKSRVWRVNLVDSSFFFLFLINFFFSFILQYWVNWELVMWISPRTLMTHYTFQMDHLLGLKWRHWKKHWMNWLASFSKGWTWGSFRASIGALLHLIHVQEGSNPPLFRPCNFDNKTVNFISVLASLVLWCFHVFRRFLTSFLFSIMCGNINYFL